MTTSVDDPPFAQIAGECYRCGYSLVGVADDQPCPECGLLAGRSRRPTDELHHSRPGWLRRLSWGVWLVLLALAVGALWPWLVDYVREWLWEHVIRPRLSANVWPPTMPPRWAISLYYQAPWLGGDVAAVVLFAGLALISRREGFAPADAADRWRRRSLLVFAAVPLLAMGIVHLASQQYSSSVTRGYAIGGSPQLGEWGIYAMLIATLGCAPLPALLFFQLRSLAKRARSAHLAEHCAIVGVGNSLTLVYVPLCLALMENAARWGLGQNWASRSPVALGFMLLMFLSAILFALWNAYLLISFAVAFGRASRRLRTQWRKSDRAAVHA
jgi:hypothetical protein